MSDDELRALAESATPGPWASTPRVKDAAVVFGPDGDGFINVLWNPGSDNDPTVDAAYVAALSPDVVLVLLDRLAAAEETALAQAWSGAEATLPYGWVFHGVSLADNSMDGGGWGPDWIASMSWPEHCEYDDCDHDEAFRVGGGSTPSAALMALARAEVKP